MALSVFGSKHWTTNIMLRSLMDRSLSSFNAAMLLGQLPPFDELAESCDSLERLWSFANGFNLKIGLLPLIFNQNLGVARSLVALGDDKSKRYAAEWIGRGDMKGHALAFESQGMDKVVHAIETWHHKTGENFELNSANKYGDAMEVEDELDNLRGKKKRVKS